MNEDHGARKTLTGHSYCVQATVINSMPVPANIYPKSALMETPPLPQAVCSRDKYPHCESCIDPGPQLLSWAHHVLSSSQLMKKEELPELLQWPFCLHWNNPTAWFTDTDWLKLPTYTNAMLYIPKAMFLLLTKTFCSGSSFKTPQRRWHTKALIRKPHQNSGERWQIFASSQLRGGKASHCDNIYFCRASAIWVCN